jgi:hypothetical protein
MVPMNKITTIATLADLATRIHQAANTVLDLADGHEPDLDEYHRLRGKAEGLRLAHSYIIEATDAL